MCLWKSLSFRPHETFKLILHFTTQQAQHTQLVPRALQQLLKTALPNQTLVLPSLLNSNITFPLIILGEEKNNVAFPCTPRFKWKQKKLIAICFFFLKTHTHLCTVLENFLLLIVRLTPTHPYSFETKEFNTDILFWKENCFRVCFS